MSIAEARIAIERKYQSIGADVLGDNNDSDVYGYESADLFYKIFPKAIVVYRSAGNTFYVPNGAGGNGEPNFVGAWSSVNWCDGFGAPLEDPVTNPDGVGLRQRFDRGQIYWHPDIRNPQVIHDGPIWSKFAEIGWERSPIGYPTGRETRLREEFPNVEVLRQSFQNGRIMVFRNTDTGGVICLAISNDGQSLPDRAYRLRLKNVKCIRESSGLGSDETGLSFVTTPMSGDTRIERWFHGDVDSDETFEVDRILYQGPLRTALNVSVIGLEKDGPRAFRTARDHFEQTMSYEDDQFDPEALEIFTGAAIATGVGLGGIIGGLVAGGAVLPYVAGAGGGVVAGVTISGSGAAAGGFIGLAIAIVLIIAIVPALKWRGTELLVLDRTVYLGDVIAGYIIAGMPPAEPAEDIEIVRGLTLSIRLEAGESPGTLHEFRTYTNHGERSVYELHYVHDLDLS